MATVEIKLRHKHTFGQQLGTYYWLPKHNKHSDNNNPSKRHKLTGPALAAQNAITAANQKVMHLCADGKIRWETSMSS